MKWPIIFALLTGLFWGTYGPALGMARIAEGPKYPFKPYIMIGVAYLVWAIVGGVAGNLYTQGEFKYSTAGASWGLIAGSLGAVGAPATVTLCGLLGEDVIVDLDFGGQPLRVKSPGRTRLAEGAQVHVRVDPEKLHVFDRATGRRIEP